MKSIYFFILFSAGTFLMQGQQKISFKDSLDHKLDLSDWVISAKGFIPVPILITEPALGGGGGLMAAVFIKPNTPYLDSIDGKLVKTRVKPNIYGGAGGYTANGTWLVGGFTTGAIKKWRANYRVATGLANVNLNFYRDFPTIGECSFEFNMKTIPFSAYLIKQINRSSWYAGLDYLFLKTELKNTNIDFNTPKEVNSIISRLGLLVDYDKRDNIFTPNKGFLFNSLIGASEDFLGSDYNYVLINSAAFAYLPISNKITSGFRVEYQQIFGDAPFYMLPYVNMRGVPVMRYQGDIVALAETEWRWDFTGRYSLVAFGGLSTAVSKQSNFQDSSWKAAGGMGARYLIARKLKLRMGIDIARGPEEWAYYIVFGTSWTR
ncbi:BamA/TamA family outer membrane protein [Flavobacterium limnophilum]|uniref:BamA/TamA family outer membrane protein n=1 Tax=Flavobacterium limnophilum TaxID=3003262 RepID=UPI002482A1C4|nr:BamA/TamA family outer membrane protein [Flavobacterium limnophilum]